MAEIPLKTKLLVRTDTTVNWSNANPVLKLGELSYDKDKQRFKVGDNTTNYISLAWATPDPQMYTDNGIFYSKTNNNFFNIQNSISDSDTIYPTVKEVRINQQVKKSADDTVDSTGLIIRSSNVGGTNDYIMVLPSFNNGPLTGAVAYLGDSNYTWTYGYINRLNSDILIPFTNATNKTIGLSNNPWTTAYITNLKGLATPTESGDAATKGYIDDAIETASNGIASSITNLQEQINGKQALVNASGILKGDGTGNIVSAVKGTDYPDPAMYTSTGIVLPDNANDTIRFGFYGGMDLFFLSSTEFYPNLANCNLGNNNGHYWMNGYIKYLKSYSLRLMDQNSTGTTTDDKDGMTMQYNEDEQCIEFLAE